MRRGEGVGVGNCLPRYLSRIFLVVLIYATFIFVPLSDVSDNYKSDPISRLVLFISNI